MVLLAMLSLPMSCVNHTLNTTELFVLLNIFKIMLKKKECLQSYLEIKLGTSGNKWVKSIRQILCYLVDDVTGGRKYIQTFCY